ncbi:MAG: hypothetical protein HBSAPP02_16500 [Phycisphaerae bacterium]|nr:MAG: hypothetical protein HBSAPP02_16500 [Phycisphaerae bacterium]
MRSMKRFTAMLSGILIACSANEAMACAVCQGNRDSQLVKGAESGVLTLVFVTYGLLIGMAGICTMWALRARRLRIQELSQNDHAGGAAS